MIVFATMCLILFLGTNNDKKNFGIRIKVSIFLVSSVNKLDSYF